MKNILLDAKKYEKFLEILRRKIEEISPDTELERLRRMQLKRLYAYLQETENCQYDLAADSFEIYIENEEIEDIFTVMFDLFL